MMQHPETVTVLRDGKEVLINKDDFDPKHEKMVDSSAPVTAAEKSLEDMSATELREYAKENDIDVKGLKSKNDLYNAIVKPDSKELFVFPNAEGKFQIVDAEGQSVDGEIYETQEDAEKELLGE